MSNTKMDQKSYKGEDGTLYKNRSIFGRACTYIKYVSPSLFSMTILASSNYCSSISLFVSQNQNALLQIPIVKQIFATDKIRVQQFGRCRKQAFWVSAAKIIV